MRRLLLLVPTLLAACGGGGSGGPDAPLLDCSVLQAPGGCWKKALKTVEGCAPSDKLKGHYADDRASCHYDQGVDVSFSGAVPDDPFAPASVFDWSFRMKVADSTCVDWSEGIKNGITFFQITTRSGLVRFESTADEASLVCDDGVRYVTDNPSSLLTCAPSRLLQDAGGATSMSLGILGEEKGATHVFTCDDVF
jgi:hypothetical protein